MTVFSTKTCASSTLLSSVGVHVVVEGTHDHPFAVAPRKVHAQLVMVVVGAARRRRRRTGRLALPLFGRLSALGDAVFRDVAQPVVRVQLLERVLVTATETNVNKMLSSFVH